MVLKDSLVQIVLGLRNSLFTRTRLTWQKIDSISNKILLKDGVAIFKRDKKHLSGEKMPDTLVERKTRLITLLEIFDKYFSFGVWENL